MEPPAPAVASRGLPQQGLGGRQLPARIGVEPAAGQHLGRVGQLVRRQLQVAAAADAPGVLEELPGAAEVLEGVQHAQERRDGDHLVGLQVHRDAVGLPGALRGEEAARRRLREGVAVVDGLLQGGDRVVVEERGRVRGFHQARRVEGSVAGAAEAVVRGIVGQSGVGDGGHDGVRRVVRDVLDSGVEVVVDARGERRGAGVGVAAGALPGGAIGAVGVVEQALAGLGQRRAEHELAGAPGRHHRVGIAPEGELEGSMASSSSSVAKRKSAPGTRAVVRGKCWRIAPFAN